MARLFQDKRFTSPLAAYIRGKLTGFSRFHLDPIVAKIPVGAYSVDELIEFLLRSRRRLGRNLIIPFNGFSDHLVKVVNGVTPDLPPPRVLRKRSGKGVWRIVFPRNIYNERDARAFYSGGIFARGLLRRTNFEQNVFAVISIYESFLSHNGETWEDLKKSHVKPLAKIAGDLQMVRFGHLMGPYKNKVLDKEHIPDFHQITVYPLRRLVSIVEHAPRLLCRAKRMFKIAEYKDGIRKVEEMMDKYKLNYFECGTSLNS